MAYVGQVGTVTVGGIVLSLTGLKILKAGLITNVWSVFYDCSIGATRQAYQVTSSKTFQMYAYVTEQENASGAGGGTALLYGDNNVGVDTATAPTNPVGMFTAVATGNNNDFVDSTETTAGLQKSGCIGASAPATKFLYIKNAAAFVTIYGYEV